MEIFSKRDSGELGRGTGPRRGLWDQLYSVLTRVYFPNSACLLSVPIWQVMRAAPASCAQSKPPPSSPPKSRPRTPEVRSSRLLCPVACGWARVPARTCPRPEAGTERAAATHGTSRGGRQRASLDPCLCVLPGATLTCLWKARLLHHTSWEGLWPARGGVKAGHTGKLCVLYAEVNA
ncbi:hypothetical protein NDU88_008656 [Pleurodeles waltl]|uniref:Uncharacterized protein n=1 Tax=Pleurodeles waltl TaxID=8319 RepID=A0AAV7NYK7_PLEWA|nr:hypothetical protein NDU88_008656 [Pleurodeles waltl]